MSFCVANCCFDLNLFESCISKLLNSPILGLMVTYLPDGYSDSSLMCEILKDFSFYRTEFFILLVRKPFIFEKRESGHEGVICGYIRVGYQKYGLIASQFYDMVQESLDVVESILPTLMACYLMLRNGGKDFDGNNVEACDIVIVLGALFCKGFPVDVNYRWPIIVVDQDLCDEYCCSSFVYSGSCFYQPFFYDWKAKNIYLESDVIKQSSVSHEVDNLVDLCSQISPNRSSPDKVCLVENDVRRRSNVISRVFKQPYLSDNFRRCIEIHSKYNKSSSAEDYCFVSSWIQIICLGDNSSSILTNCAHYAPKPRMNITNGPTSHESEENEEERKPYSTTLRKRTFDNPVIIINEPWKDQPKGFKSLVEHFSLEMVKANHSHSGDPKNFVAIPKSLNTALPRIGLACSAFPFPNDVRNYVRSYGKTDFLDSDDSEDFFSFRKFLNTEVSQIDLACSAFLGHALGTSNQFCIFNMDHSA